MISYRKLRFPRDGQQHGHRGEGVRGMRGARGHVRQTHLQRRSRVHREEGPRADQWHHQGHALRARPVLRERNQRGELQRDSEPRPAEGLHVFHLQGACLHIHEIEINQVLNILGSIHKQLH